MGPAMLMIGTDDSTTMTNIGRSLARSSSPSIDVAVRHSQCDGTQNDTLSKHCLAVVVEYGVEPWVPEGVDHVFISYAGPWYRGRRVDRRISDFDFPRCCIQHPAPEGVKFSKAKPVRHTQHSAHCCVCRVSNPRQGLAIPIQGSNNPGNPNPRVQ